MDFKLNKNLIPLFIAIGIGLAAMAYYIWSGRSSYDLNVRGLAQEENIQSVGSVDAKKIAIRCKNGENYEITFKKDQGDYADLVFNACGPEGALE